MIKGVSDAQGAAGWGFGGAGGVCRADEINAADVEER
jgi:hypothetical protein